MLWAVVEITRDEPSVVLFGTKGEAIDEAILRLEEGNVTITESIIDDFEAEGSYCESCWAVHVVPADPCPQLLKAGPTCHSA